MAPSRNVCLDGLRGYAALIVVVHHFVAAFWPTAFFRGGEGLALTFSETPLALLVNGPFFVFVFFVLSGYVLAGVVSRPAELPAQIAARYVRLGVPAGASVVLAALLLVLGLNFIPEVVAMNGNRWLESVFSVNGVPWWKATGDVVGTYFITGRSPLNFVLWTMQIEFFGSVIVYLVNCLVASAKRRVWVYLAMGFGLLVADAIAVSFGFKARLLFLSPFVFGALMREAGVIEAVGGRWRYWFMFAVALFLGGAPHSKAAGTVYEPIVAAIAPLAANPYYMLKVVASILLVYSVIRLRVGFFETRFAVWLGDLSFASYLVHTILLSSVAAWMFIRLPAEYLALQFLIYLAATYAVAVVFHRYVDGPAMAWSRRIKRRVA